MIPQLANEAPVQQQIRVVVADDHPVVRSGIVYELERQPDIIVLGAAENGDAALLLAQTHQPDVLVLDLSMPGLPAAEVIRQVRAMPSAAGVMMLTAYGEPELVLSMLQAGAIGYVLKDADPSEIAIAVRPVRRRERWLSAAIADILVDTTVRKATEPAQRPLSARELEVLRLLAAGKTNQGIGSALDIMERTVSFHISNITGKLRLRNRSEVIAWAIRHGFGSD